MTQSQVFMKLAKQLEEEKNIIDDQTLDNEIQFELANNIISIDSLLEPEEPEDITNPENPTISSLDLF